MMYLKRNLHDVERLVRVLVGIALLTLVFVGPQSLWGLVGIVLIVTGVLGYCWMYRLFGISTCRGSDQV